jgi:RimJ/RimL family protein N-acetyltransferase
MLYNIETPRLLLRDLLPEDAAGFLEMERDPEVHTYLGKKPVTEIEKIYGAIDMIRAQYDKYSTGRCAVIEKSSGNFMGWAGLKYVDFEVNGNTGFYDMGYRFAKRYWGKGYASEAAAVSAQFAWDVLKAQEISAFVDTGNIASQKVLEKTGLRFVEEFQYEGEPHLWYTMKRP